MDVLVTRRGQRFIWDSEKASSNFSKHGIRFEEALEVLFDPLHLLQDASVEDEDRLAAIGLDLRFRTLFVVHIEREAGRTRLISAREASVAERKAYEEF